MSWTLGHIWSQTKTPDSPAPPRPPSPSQRKANVSIHGRTGSARSTGSSGSARGRSRRSSAEVITDSEALAKSEDSRSLASIMNSQEVETALGFVILVNLAIVVVETDYGAAGVSNPVWLLWVNRGFLGIYSCEISLRLYVSRSVCAFLRSGWNVLDGVIIAFDIVFQGMNLLNVSSDGPLVGFLRVIRLIRLARAFRVLIAFPELYTLLHGIFSALKAIMWGAFLVALIMIMYGIVAVEIIQPLVLDMVKTGSWGDCERCQRAFGSVWNACLTFIQQLIAGDSWGLMTLPLLERHPWLAFFFFSMILVIAIGMLNLILAVIVDRAAEARKEDVELVVQMKEMEARKSKAKLMKCFRQLDKDDSGYLSLSEILVGFDTVPEFSAILRALDVDADHLEILFHLMDADGSGSVSCDEFATKIFDIKTKDIHTILGFLQHELSETSRCLVKLAQAFSLSMSASMMNEELSKQATSATKSKFANTPDRQDDDIFKLNSLTDRFQIGVFELVQQAENIDSSRSAVETLTHLSELSAKLRRPCVNHIASNMNMDSQPSKASMVLRLASSEDEFAPSAGGSVDTLCLAKAETCCKGYSDTDMPSCFVPKAVKVPKPLFASTADNFSEVGSW